MQIFWCDVDCSIRYRNYSHTAGPNLNPYCGVMSTVHTIKLSKHNCQLTEVDMDMSCELLKSKQKGKKSQISATKRRPLIQLCISERTATAYIGLDLEMDRFYRL